MPGGQPRLRVVYLDHCAQLSGGELALVRLLPFLEQAVDGLVVLADDGPLVARLQNIGVDTEVLPMAEVARGLPRDRVRPSRLPLTSALHTVAYTARLARRLRSLGPDLVHTNSLKSGVYGCVAARLARVPAIWHVHDRMAEDYLPHAATVLIRTLVAHLPAAVIANSRSTLATVARPGLVAEVIASPVPTIAVPTGDGERDGATLRVGMVGRLAPWKGQHVFLAAFAQAFPDGGAEAVIVGAALFGESTYEDDLREQVTRLGLDGRVRFTGFLADVGDFLVSLDVLVHASVIPEPFGQVVVEGMAAGLAVVASDAGGPAEVITHGCDGVLVAPSDPDALAQALLDLAGDADGRHALGVAARKRARDFDPDLIAEQVLQLYRQVLAGGPPRGAPIDN